MAEETNILAQEKSRTIKLSDGKDYILPPIDMTTLANIEKTMGFSLNKFASKVEEATMGTLRLCAYAFLKENYPELTLEQAGRLAGVKEMQALGEYFSIIMAISS